MSALAFLAALLLPTSPPMVQEGGKGLLTLDRILGPEFSASFGPPLGRWRPDGLTMLSTRASSSGQDVIVLDPVTGKTDVLVPAAKLTPKGAKRSLDIEQFSLSEDEKRLLIFTNSSRVWRQNTKGDYWTLDIASGVLKKVAANADSSSLMFAKLSPDGTKVGYVCKNDLYVQDIASAKVVQLTSDGTEQLVNGTFDWVYEEELDLRDGWRWSPDGKSIAYWQLDMSAEPTYTLINDTDALYPTTKRFPYPKAGQTNPTVRIGVVPVEGGSTNWIDVVADSKDGYLARMDWAANSDELIVQHLNRLQNKDDFLLADAKTGKSRMIFSDTDAAWVDVGQNGTDPKGVRWVNGGKEFLTLSERDGWRHLYSVSRDGANVRTLTPGDFDVDEVLAVDQGLGCVYFSASPKNSTQRYLFRTQLNGEPRPQRLTPSSMSGTCTYQISPTGAFGIRNHSTYGTPPEIEVVRLPDDKPVRVLADNERLKSKLKTLQLGKATFLQLKTDDGQEMDASLILPPNFDSHKRYPLFFSVYGEPAGATVNDRWEGSGFLFDQLLAQKGYIVASVDNRGTPALKGRQWRKSIYKKIGVVASADQAAAARQLSRLPYVDASRIGIWGWSGGGSMTLNMLFRYPDLYKVGMSVAPVPDTRLYDTIYQERYMGLPQDDPKVYEQCSPITFAKQLKGSLLVVHGSGDDNVHYQGTERLVNELVAHNKPFQLMVYPNRTHGIYEGPGTTRHLYELLVRFLTTNMPPG